MRSDAEAPEDAQSAIACEHLSQFQQVTVTPVVLGHAALARCGRLYGTGSTSPI